VEKNGFPGAVLGLSGGIDSALTLALAVDALGGERVRALLMPSPYTAQTSLDDAVEQAQKLGASYEIIPIEPMMQAYGRSLAPQLKGKKFGVTEENLQSRIRGALLMAFSNAFGHIVLATGNKSELATGYATLYGDMCGGFAALKDVYKTRVYALADWRNTHVPPGGLGPEGLVIPARVLTKAPTAELRPNQTDQDTLPPYDVLDAILRGLIEEQMDAETLVECGYARETVARVARMLYAAEFKRRQAAPGVKITERAFGRDRRYPITNAYRD
jgi:NAD+ synthase